MSNIYFTSDLHFGHELMLKLYSKTRPFKSTNEMNQSIVDGINSCVKNGDELYILGDFSFLNQSETSKILNRLNGKKHLILGNHDRDFRAGKISGFESINEHLVKKFTAFDGEIVMFHYPIYEWYNFHRGSYHLYGHIHDEHAALKGENSLNVSWDIHGRVIELGEIKSLIKAKI